MKPSHFYPVVLILLSLSACKEEEVKPAEVAKPDPFIGLWRYTDSYADVNMAVDFEAVKSIDGYIFKNVKIKYSEIPATETLTYKVEASDMFSEGNGFGQIRVIGSWTTTCPNGMTCDKWIFVTFTYNTIQQKAANTYIMNARNVTILMINKEEIVLDNQELIKVTTN